MPLHCQSCGYENRRSAVFCGGCGQPLIPSSKCSACGGDNPIGQRYCNKCGAPLAGERSAVSQAAALRPVAALPRPGAAPYRLDSPPLVFLGTTLVFVGAAFVRFFRLGDIPLGFIALEEKFREAALDVLDRGWIGLWSESLGGQASGLAYVLSGWAYFFGDQAASLRLVAAAASVATVALFYLFCRSQFGVRAAVLGALLLAFSLWHLTYSRLALPDVLLPLLVLGVAHLLFMAFAETRSPVRQTRLLVLAGVSLGVGFYFHNATTVFAVAVALLWVREFLAAEHPVDTVVRRSLAFFVPLLIVALPYLGFLAGEGSEVAGHVRGVAVTSSAEFRELAGVPEKVRYVLANIGRSGSALLWRRAQEGDERPSHRLLDPVTAVLMAVGLAVGLWRFGDRRHVFLWILLATTLVAASLTAEPGIPSRLLLALPAVFAFAGLGFDWLLTWVRGRVPRATEYVFVALVVMVVVASNLVAFYGDHAWLE